MEESENEENEENLELFNNKQYRAFRDDPPSVPSAIKAPKGGDYRTQSVSAEEIRKKVASSMKKRPAAGNKPANRCKTAANRANRDNIKSNEGGVW